MKKQLLVAAIIPSLTFGLVACSSSKSGTETNTSNAPKQEVKKTIANADEVVNILKEDGLPIGNKEVYTAENDPNKLLGRPGQYTSKVNFVDTRVKQEGDVKTIDVVNGGSVEMFASEDEAKKGFDYVSNITKSNPMFTEYDYLSGKIFLRVSKELTPEQAKAYETALNKMAK